MKKIRSSKKYRKILLLVGAFSLMGSATLTAVACGEGLSAADQNTKYKIGQGDVVTEVLNNYYDIILQDRFKDSNGKFDQAALDVTLKQVFNWYVHYQTSLDISYWPTQYGSWLTSGYITTTGDPTSLDYLNPLEFDPENLLPDQMGGFGSDANIDHDYAVVMKSIPVLKLELLKVAIVMQYFEAGNTSSSPIPFEVQKYFDKKDASNSIDKQYKDANNYWLVKYIQENKPNFAWQITYVGTNAPDPIENATTPSPETSSTNWDAALRTFASQAKVSPFGTGAVGTTTPGLNALLNTANSMPNLTSPLSINLDEIGGFLGIVNGNSTLVDGSLAGANGFNYDDSDITQANMNSIGYISNDQSGAPGSAIKLVSAVTGQTWSTAVNVGSAITRTIVAQIYNQSSFVPKSGDDDPYYKYVLSGITNNAQIRKYMEFMIAVQNTGQVDTAREFYYNLGYQVHTYVQAIRDKLQGIPNLLAND